ncbi:MAG TPA: methyltransferase domain-containing protein [Terriglobia bacterium]|nr:methyltransferase domain-containing protein [Terriglobia bacterium]
MLRPVRVKRDFSAVYRQEADPWEIGNADSSRYNLYHRLLMEHSVSRASILDIGCGFGAFLSRFEGAFQSLTGLELSPEAIAKGQHRYPAIHFVHGSAAAIHEAISGRFDAIVFSDVIYYLNDAAKNRSLEWISTHLSPSGIALIAAWCPGGTYLEVGELRYLINRYLSIVHEESLESQHAVFVCRPRKKFVAVTVDYETWQPVPAGKHIDWERDVFAAGEQLIKLFDEENVKLTFMAEMGEYFWLEQNQPQVALRMADQWRQAVSHGHDVQLHLHPNWLPELGASCNNGNWHWDWAKRKADDYPGDLCQLINKCKVTLEEILKRVDSTYRVTSFRAGAYSAQPFSRLHEALAANGIVCDSSVFAGGVSEERGYDYRFAYSNHQPYFANRFDPQLKAPPSENSIIELPLFAFERGRRWSFDGEDGLFFSKRLLDFYVQRRSRLTLENARRVAWLKGIYTALYFSLQSVHGWVNRVLPKRLAYFITSYGSENLTSDDYFVLIAHTKSELDYAHIRQGIRDLKKMDFEFMTLSGMVQSARQSILTTHRKSALAEADYQVAREYTSVMGSARNYQQSHHLQSLLPMDRRTVLDLGCGAGYWSHRIHQLYPWMSVTGVDWGQDFIARAVKEYSSDTVQFKVEDFSALSFDSESYDCVYADNTLEHAFDVDRVLSEVFRVLRRGGVLVAAIPSDGRNPARICDNHTWKTVPHEVKLRLQAAGFIDIELDEIDTFRQLGMPPYPPSDDKMMYIRAWKRDRPVSRLERAREIMAWVYDNLKPDKASTSNDAAEILAGGYAFCIGYALVLGRLLQKEGFSVEWVTMLAKGHPKGRGPDGIDSHEVLQVGIDGASYLFDPMANTFIPYSLDDILKNPSLAILKQNPDPRYVERRYDLYDTDFWYRRVFKYAVRLDPEKDARWVEHEPIG